MEQDNPDKEVKLKDGVCPCGKPFIAQVKRGRPRIWCDDHTTDYNYQQSTRRRLSAPPPDESEEDKYSRKMTADERVAYLEQLLKSRHTHISQHSKD